MPDWRIGQTVVCIKHGEWICVGTNQLGAGPSYREQCQIIRIVTDRILPRDMVWLGLSGHPGIYDHAWFRPLVEDKTQFALLQSLVRRVQQPERV